MATNFFFDHYDNKAEQELLADLIEESIQIHGDDMYYVSRTAQNLDKIYETDDQPIYDSALMIEMYIKSIRGFGGDRDFLRQFGAEIRDEVVFSVSCRAFDREVGTYTGTARPLEGDLVFFPLNKKCFVIKFVDSREMFYQLGALYTFELTCELFEYSGERFDTGIPEIDSISSLSTNVVDWALLTEDGQRIMTEDGDYIVVDNFILEELDAGAENKEFQEEFDEVVDWTDVDPFSEGIDR